MIFNRNKDSIRRRPNDKFTDRSNNFSYHSHRSNIDSLTGRLPKTNPKKSINKNNLLHNLPSYVAIVVVLVSIIYAMTLNTNPKIEIISSSNQEYIQPLDIYQTTAENDLKGSIFNRSKLTIDTTKIENKLSSQFPELSAVSVIIPLLSHRPVIEIKASNTELILTNSDGSYLVNQNGVAELKLATNARIQNFDLPVITDKSGLAFKTGDTVITTSTISFINTIIYQFKAKSQTIQSITISDIPYELDVQVRGEPYYIKFDTLNNALYEVGTYYATLKLLGITAPTQYIDVRIPGRAYYK